jgi:hypothetical protein
MGEDRHDRSGLIWRVSDLLQETGWSFVLMEHASRIQLQVPHNGRYHSVELQVREESQIILGMLAYKRKVDPENVDRMIHFMNKANFALLLGGFEMNPETGQVKYRNAVDVESLELTAVFVHNFLRSVAALGIKYADAVDAVLDGKSLKEAHHML